MTVKTPIGLLNDHLGQRYKIETLHPYHKYIKIENCNIFYSDSENGNDTSSVLRLKQVRWLSCPAYI